MAFANVTEENVRELLSKKDSFSTKRSVRRSVKLFRDFLESKGKPTSFESMENCELNSCLCLFYASIRKKGGEYMKKSSVNLLKYGLSKHLKDTKNVDLKNDKSFSSSNEVFSAVLTDLKKKGFGSVCHKPPISKEDLRILYHPKSIVLNVNTPSGLLHKVWLDIMMYLCRRGRENLREMTRNTFAVGTDGSGRRFVTQCQDENDKNHRSTDSPNDTVGEGRMYERPGDPMCPVASYLKYLSKLNHENNSLWQKPFDSFSEDDTVWYTRAPIGKNSLSSMMPNISKLAKLSVVYTNHSIRATSIKEMDDAGIEARHIMRVSGHKSETSIRSYSERLSDEKKLQISECLSKTLTGVDVIGSIPNDTTSVSNASASLTEFLPANFDISELFSDDFQFEEITNSDASVNITTEPNDAQICNSFAENSSNASATIATHNNISHSTPMQFSNIMGSFASSENTSVKPYITNCTVNFNFYSK